MNLVGIGIGIAEREGQGCLGGDEDGFLGLEGDGSDGGESRVARREEGE